MDKYSKRSIARLWIAVAVLMALCTTTETLHKLPQQRIVYQLQQPLL